MTKWYDLCNCFDILFCIGIRVYKTKYCRVQLGVSEVFNTDMSNTSMAVILIGPYFLANHTSFEEDCHARLVHLSFSLCLVFSKC